jgi:DNA repair exonuclease SbcCD ATPase subunit
MARIALGITLVLLLATCFFGFETRSKVTDLNGKVSTLGSELSSAQQRLAKTEADLKTSQENLAKETSDDEKTKADLATATSSLADATAQVTTLQGKVDDLQKQIVNITGKQVVGGPAVTGPTQKDMDDLTAKLKETQSQVAELTQVKETLTNKMKDAETRADDLQKVVDHYKQGFVKNGLEGEVLAVNQGWNFVVLSIGDRQGAVTNAEMTLKRGGSQVGKVRITSVEPSTSVADIIPGSLAKGVKVEPGDRVIFQGN